MSLSRPRRRTQLCQSLGLCLGLALSLPVFAACVDEDEVTPAADVTTSALPPPEPRLVLPGLVRDALARSQAVGAARLLAEAALLDIDEARAAKALHAGFNADLGPSATQSGSTT